MKADVLAVMDAAYAALDVVYSQDDLRKDLGESRVAIAKLIEAAEWHLRCIDEYPENPVPMNRNSGTTRELRAALAKVTP